jgi:uncharacterized membrane protein
MRIYLSEIGAIHFFAACASLALGLAVLMLRKGTRVHRALGLTYVFAMLSVNGSALMLYHLTGHFEVFHGLALVSLFGVIRGVSAAIFKWKDWLLSHYRAMSFSYVGLLAAAAAEAMVRIPALRVHTAGAAIAIGAAIAVLFTVLGTVVVRRYRPMIAAMK